MRTEHQRTSTTKTWEKKMLLIMHFRHEKHVNTYFKDIMCVIVSVCSNLRLLNRR